MSIIPNLDDDDLSHAEELSYSSQVTSTSVESLTSSNTNLNIVLPTGWHRHPHMHMHKDPELGPLDEIVNDHDNDDDEEPIVEHIYSSVRKSSKEVTKPRLASAVLRSSRILRRHTTYYHAKQFDSLPPQGSLMSTSISSNKPHVHSWHRHKKHHQVSPYIHFCLFLFSVRKILSYKKSRLIIFHDIEKNSNKFLDVKVFIFVVFSFHVDFFF